MARGQTIVISECPRGVETAGHGKTGETFYPGMIVQMDPSVSLIGNRHTFKIYNRDADGNNPAGAFYVVREHAYRDIDQPYAANEMLNLYVPLPGEEVNLLLANIAGTGDDHTAGEILMVDDGTGKLIATTGSPEREVAMLLEDITDPTTDNLVWTVWGG
jgi:hypothetical protein